MTQLQIDEINKSISYQEGKIYHELNKGLTSKTMQYLKQCGYTTIVEGKLHILKDEKGHKVTTGLTWSELLRNTAIVMR